MHLDMSYRPTVVDWKFLKQIYKKNDCLVIVFIFEFVFFMVTTLSIVQQIIYQWLIIWTHNLITSRIKL